MVDATDTPAADPSGIIPAELLGNIERLYPSFSKGLKAVADYILHNPATFCFLPVQELAHRANVSHATVLRFCKALGYSGFLEFSREVQQIVQAGLSSVNRFDLTKDYLDSPREKQTLFATALDMEIQALVATARSIPHEEVERCVSMMVRADHIFIVGAMASCSLALHLEQTLSRATSNAYLVPAWSAQTVAMLDRVTPQSLVIGIAFPRYPSLTLDFVKLAKETNCSVIAITNTPHSPLAKLADRSLFVPAPMLSYIDLYAAPIAVCTALVLEYSSRDPKKTAERLSMFDKTASRQHLFFHK
jgi:Transcriptional regulators